MISRPDTPSSSSSARNVLGTTLESCSTDPLTGFYRTGCCETGPDDLGRHVVCIIATAEFLEFTKACGNDLSTPIPQYGFPGVRPGDRWCLCASRWAQALDAGRKFDEDLRCALKERDAAHAHLRPT